MALTFTTAPERRLDSLKMTLTTAPEDAQKKDDPTATNMIVTTAPKRRPDGMKINVKKTHQKQMTKYDERFFA